MDPASPPARRVPEGREDPDGYAKGIGTIFSSEDAREGATAFAEKRAPAWKGR